MAISDYINLAKIRVFTAGKQSDLDQSKLNLSALLNKFRIESSDIIIISDLQNKPSSDGVDKVKKIIKNGTRDPKNPIPKPSESQLNGQIFLNVFLVQWVSESVFGWHCGKNAPMRYFGRRYWKLQKENESSNQNQRNHQKTFEQGKTDYHMIFFGGNKG